MNMTYLILLLSNIFHQQVWIETGVSLGLSELTDNMRHHVSADENKLCCSSAHCYCMAHIISPEKERQ
jgi:hypothetical protein